MNRAISAAFFTACLLVFATPALAEPYSLVPSGNSATDQYAETLPGADGNHGAQNPADRDPKTTDERPGLPAWVIEELSQSGPSGEAAGQVLERTSPVYEGEGGSMKESNSVKDSALAPVRVGSDDPEVSSFGAAFAGLTDGGLGILLPLALLTIAVATIALLTRRGRRS